MSNKQPMTEARETLVERLREMEIDAVRVCENCLDYKASDVLDPNHCLWCSISARMRETAFLFRESLAPPDAAPPQDAWEGRWKGLAAKAATWALERPAFNTPFGSRLLTEMAALEKQLPVAAPDAAGRVEPPTLSDNQGNELRLVGYAADGVTPIVEVLAAVPAAAPPLALEWLTDEVIEDALQRAAEAGEAAYYADFDRSARDAAFRNRLRAVLTQAAQAGGK